MIPEWMDDLATLWSLTDFPEWAVVWIVRAAQLIVDAATWLADRAPRLDLAGARRFVVSLPGFASLSGSVAAGPAGWLVAALAAGVTLGVAFAWALGIGQ